MARVKIAAAVAIAAFRGVQISVQEAKPTKTKDADGKERTGFAVRNVPLRVEHVLAASQDDKSGQVFITTIDGKRYDAEGELPKADKAEKTDKDKS